MVINMENTYKVLIIDDDVFYVEVMTRIFSREKYGIEIALDGEDGLKKVKSFNPDIVLLDIRMPKMDGIAVVRELKKDPSTKDIPVILVSNLADERDAGEVAGLSDVQSLVKANHTPDEIFQKVKETLESKQK